MLPSFVIPDVVIPKGFCVAVDREKVWASWEINLVIGDMLLYSMSLYPKFTVLFFLLFCLSFCVLATHSTMCHAVMQLCIFMLDGDPTLVHPLGSP